MTMLPIFMGGFLVGIWAHALYKSYKEERSLDENSSKTEAQMLTHCIMELKEEIALLEKDNSTLRSKLADLENRK